MDAPGPFHRDTTIRWSLFRNLVLLIVAISAALLVSTVCTGRRIAADASLRLIERALDHGEAEVGRFFQPVEETLRLTARWVTDGRIDVSDREALNGLFLPLLETPQMSSVNLGDADGRGFLLLRLGDRWRNRSVNHARTGDRLDFHEWDRAGGAARSWTVDAPAAEERYDPRTRAWYRVVEEARNRGESADVVQWTKPYLFFSTRDPGITAAREVVDPDGRRSVVAIDVLLEDLSEFTRSVRISENGLFAILNEERQILGLPGSAAFEDPEARRDAYLKRLRDLPIPAIAEGVRARMKLGGDAPGSVVYRSEGEDWYAGGRIVALSPSRRLILAVAVPARDLVGPIQELRVAMLGIGLVALLLATLMALLLSRRYSRPLARLVEDNEKIGALELGGGAPIETGLTEVRQLAEAQERMRIALQSFARYVPADVVRELLRRNEAARIGGLREELTILFTDVAGFTGIAESMTPEALTAHMADYFRELLAILRDTDATVDKFVGDAVVAFWGAPQPDPEHARHAVTSVLRCQARLAELNGVWADRGLPPLPTRFGLASGPAVVGNVGAPERLSYTALGDAVNVASRVEGLNRFYGTTVLATEHVRISAGDGFEWRRVDRVRVKGKRDAVEILEPLGPCGAVPEALRNFARDYEAALADYRGRRFAEAAARLSRLSESHPADLSVARLRTLTEKQRAGPDEAWEPVSAFLEK